MCAIFYWSQAYLLNLILTFIENNEFSERTLSPSLNKKILKNYGIRKPSRMQNDIMEAYTNLPELSINPRMSSHTSKKTGKYNPGAVYMQS